MDLQDGPPTFLLGPFHHDLAIKSAGPDQGSVEMSPGQTGSLTMNVDEVSDPSDPVVAKLVYMGGALTHLKVVLGDDAASATPFTVASDVCKNLCTVVHEVQCFEAAVTESGT
ncbi:MAG: hypothetical protein DSY92_05370, partial [Planctomycetota bacterium]